MQLNLQLTEMYKTVKNRLQQDISRSELGLNLVEQTNRGNQVYKKEVRGNK